MRKNKITNPSKSQQLLGLKVEPSESGIYLSQRAYIGSVLKSYRSISLPINCLASGVCCTRHLLGHTVRSGGSESIQLRSASYSPYNSRASNTTSQENDRSPITVSLNGIITQSTRLYRLRLGR
jgi:hypothetical protein